MDMNQVLEVMSLNLSSTRPRLSLFPLCNSDLREELIMKPLN